MFNISNIKTKVGKGLVQLFNEMIRFKRDFIPFFCPSLKLCEKNRSDHRKKPDPDPT